jgi:hypothetical protein
MSDNMPFEIIVSRKPLQTIRARSQGGNSLQRVNGVSVTVQIPSRAEAEVTFWIRTGVGFEVAAIVLSEEKN